MAFDSGLLALLQNIGRHGDTVAGEQKRQAIEQILSERKQHGISIDDSGVHHAV